MEKELGILLKIESLICGNPKKEKIELLKNNYSIILEYLLKVSFDPFLSTKLNKLEVLENQPYLVNYDIFPYFKDLTTRLFQSNSLDNKFREEAFELVNCINYPYELRKILGKILTKKLTLGISSKSINKIYNKEIIADPCIMLVGDENQVPKWNGIICEEKFSGIRMITYISGNKISFFTEKFKEIPYQLLEKIGDECFALLKESDLKGDWFFDGVLTCDNIKLKKIKRNTQNVIYNVFDLDEGETLKRGKGIISFDIRRFTLEGIFLLYKTTLVNISESFLANEKEAVYEYYKSLGKDVIMKNPEHVYECKKSKNWVKLKI